MQQALFDGSDDVLNLPLDPNQIRLGTFARLAAFCIETVGARLGVALKLRA